MGCCSKYFLYKCWVDQWVNVVLHLVYENIAHLCPFTKFLVKMRFNIALLKKVNAYRVQVPVKQ